MPVRNRVFPCTSLDTTCIVYRISDAILLSVYMYISTEKHIFLFTALEWYTWYRQWWIERREWKWLCRYLIMNIESWYNTFLTESEKPSLSLTLDTLVTFTLFRSTASVFFYHGPGDVLGPDKCVLVIGPRCFWMTSFSFLNDGKMSDKNWMILFCFCSSLSSFMF
jgi:hypothetical protein